MLPAVCVFLCLLLAIPFARGNSMRHELRVPEGLRGPFNANARASWCDMMEEEAGWFICIDHKEPWCIAPVLKCNNDPDCQDGSDEMGCSDNTPETYTRLASTYCSGCDSLSKKFLDLHNELRLSEPASNMNELQWSCCASRQAAAWASTCSMGPRWGENPHGMMDPDFGQNVGRMYRLTPPTDDEILTIVRLWHGEREYYDYDTDKCKDGFACGHYKAMTNAYLREIGCAVKNCTRSRVVDGKTETAYFYNIICNYRPWPNWKIWPGHPDQPFIKGDKCGKCQPGLTCRSNLCA